MTDNRTNEPTEAQVEAACKAHEFTNAFGPERETRMRAALKAAGVVPDAATKDLEDQLANAKAGWDSALRIVNSGNEIIKQVGAERDAALARTAEATEAHEEDHKDCCGGKGYCRECYERWPCPTRIALGLNEGENDG